MSPLIMDSKLRGGLEVTEHSLRSCYVYFERFEVVSAEGGNAIGDVWSTSECCIHEGTEDLDPRPIA
jgi:hypothetical protein